MPPLIIEQIRNNSDHKILGFDIQAQLNDSKNISELSFWTITPFQDLSFNNRTVSPNCVLSTFNLGLIDTITIYLTFIQNQPHDQGTNFEETFWSDYEPIHEVPNIYGIISDGKTHLDSVVEGVVKKILSALESFVKAVKELASMAYGWIWNAISSLFNPVFKPIRDGILQYFINIGRILRDSLEAYLNGKNPLNTSNKLFDAIFTPFLKVIGLIVIILLIVFKLATPFLLIVPVLLGSIMDYIKPLIFTAFSGLVSSLKDDPLISILKNIGSSISNAIINPLLNFLQPYYIRNSNVGRGGPTFSDWVSVIFSITDIMVLTPMLIEIYMGQLVPEFLDTLSIIFSFIGFILSLVPFFDVIIAALQGKDTLLNTWTQDALAFIGLLFSALGLGVAILGTTTQGVSPENTFAFIFALAGLLANIAWYR